MVQIRHKITGAVLLEVEGDSLANRALIAKKLMGANLAGLDLSGSNLSNSDLRETDMTGATLERTVLAITQLRLEECAAEIRELAAEELRAFAESAPSRRGELTKQLADVERQLGNVVNLLADVPSDAL